MESSSKVRSNTLSTKLSYPAIFEQVFYTPTVAKHGGVKITHRRGSVAKRVYPQRPPSPAFRKDVAVLRSSGMSLGGTAKTLGVSRDTIVRVQRLPDVRQDIARLRQNWKAITQDRIETMATETWEMAKEFVAQRDSKSFDNTMRGIASMEKVSSSVSGESQKVEVSGIPPASPQIELRALILQLIGSERA